jgi:reverse transcriptase-like protein
MPSLSDSDLRLALKRVLADHDTDRVFISNRVEVALVGSSRDKWLERLLEKIAAWQYVPSPAIHIDVPKENAGIRTGTILTFEDQVVYCACVGNLLPLIGSAFKWADPKKDCSYQFNELKGTRWLVSRFECWEEFRTRSIKKLESGATLVMVTDITTYYDAISIEILASDLRKIGGDDEVINLLVTCLSRWAVVNGRGVPQGCSASDILAKLYLNVVDKSLAAAGYDHLRYVDDFRVFCPSRAAAKQSIIHLAQRLRRRGLNLVGSKTHILAPAAARNKFDGVMPTLRPLGRRYIAEIAEIADVDPTYLTIAEAEVLIEKKGISPPTEMLRTAYETYFIEASTDFNKTLFRYLLNRLGVAEDDFAVEHALSLLRDHPEETAPILEYARRAVSTAEIEVDLVDFLASGDAVYAYQQYQILAWRLLRDDPLSDEFLSIAREMMASSNIPPYLRSAARMLLAKFGTDADIDDIASSYSEASADFERAELVCCLYRMEKSRRNALLGQAKKDGFFASAAVSLVKKEAVAEVLTASAS